MPVISVDMFQGRTAEQKRALAEGFTKTFCDVTQAKPEAVIVIFRDVPRENWATAGMLASESS